MTRLYLVIAAVAVGIGFAVWLRADAAGDRERALRAQQSADRLRYIEQSKELQNEVEDMSDPDLADALCRVLSAAGQCD